jgi:hypothetical protein
MGEMGRQGLTGLEELVGLGMQVHGQADVPTQFVAYDIQEVP